ncbi:MAG: sigma-70 family RNA polymerase sigma factor [Verrucomicrobiota bacterium]
MPPVTPPNQSPLFATTRWSVVMVAREKEGAAASAALETLCAVYWYPLYAFVRRLGNGPHDAQDLTQEFFARLLAKEWLGSVVRERGRFRTFLITALRRFLANEWDRARAGKRGSGKIVLSLDADAAEARYRAEPSTAAPADQIYERRWALTLLDQTMSRLRAEYERNGQMEAFEQLKEYLTAERNAIPYDEVAGSLGTSEGAARVAVHRLRKRFREVFRETIADTVAQPAEVDEEVRYIVSVLGGV